MPIRIDNPRGCSGAQPITLGIPLPRGILADPCSVGLLDNEARTCSVQTQPLAHWSDGSVKWLLLDFLLPDAPTERSVWTLQLPGPGVKPTPFSPFHIDKSEEGLSVDTGTATFKIGTKYFTLIRQVIVEGKEVLDSAAGQILLTDEVGRRVPLRIERMEVEARGPVRTTVRLEGRLPGKSKCRFVARICCFAGTGLLRLRLTVHNPRRARHKGGLWDLGDPGSLLFRELALELGLRVPPWSVFGWKTEQCSQPRYGSGSLEIYQGSSGGKNWQSRNHVNRHGRVPSSFRGYRAHCGNEAEFGHRASPVVTIHSETRCLAVAVPEYWQQFPKAIEISAGRLRIGLFPRQFGDLFELQGGEQKTHTIWLDFRARDSWPESALEWVHNPAKASVEPEWYARSGAVPQLAAAEKSSDIWFDTYLHEIVQGENSLFARRELIDEFGWRNFGEVYADHEGAFYRGPAPIISHYNNQYDQVYGELLQYWRSGDARWLELADALARHVIDIDIYHTNEDRAAYNGGLFWFTDHYKAAATCTHRTYSRSNRRPADRSYGGGPCCCHNFSTGLLHYYYLTGDPLARESVLGLADWVVGMDDGRRNILGWIDDGPTGLASFTNELTYQGPGRGAGLSINALIDGWLVSEQRSYLDKAEELIRRCVHPADDIAARDLLDIPKRWSYTIFLTALARYLQIKAEAEEIDSTYAYAQASLVHYASWMLDNERPYSERYPREPWAAQEVRKANVLRLAASHVEEPLRGRLLKRGMELADRAWDELLSSQSRFMARTIAILLTEGTHDNYFRTQAVPSAPVVSAHEDYGAPLKFVPQKRRVQAQLKTLPGLGRALLHLANPRRWCRMLYPSEPRP